MTMTTSPSLELGYFIADFGWNKKRAKFLMTLWGLLLPLSLFSALIIVGIPLAMINLWLVYRSFCRLKSSQAILSLYTNGLVDHRQQQATVLYYDNISKIYTAIDSASGQLFYTYTVHTHTDEQLKFSIEVASTKQLGDTLQEGMLANQLQQHLSDLENGASISFDRLQLSAEGLTLRNKHLPWQELSTAEIHTVKTRKMTVNFLDIYQKGQSGFWARFQRNKFPNLFLFFTLIEHFSQ